MATFSRITRRQQRSALVSALLMIGGAIALILLFAYVLLPLLVKRMDSRSNMPVESDTVPPAAPQLNSTYEATNSATLALSGFAEQDSVVTLRKNGTILEESSATNGQFEFPHIQLSPGVNKLEFTAKDAAGNESSSSKVSVLFSMDPPDLQISSPQNNATITRRRDQVITIQGTTSPDAKVLINEKVAIVSSDGSFSASVQLQEGTNTIVVKAINPAGNQAQQELSVNFTP